MGGRCAGRSRKPFILYLVQLKIFNVLDAHAMHKRYSVMFLLFFLTISSLCRAEDKTPEELCRQRNAASCEVGGLKFFIEDGCPKGAKVLRPKGNERCDQLSVTVEATAKPAAGADGVKPLPVREAAPASASEEAHAGYWKNIFFVLAVIGLLQGLITQAGVWPFVFVGVMMPLIATWGMLSGADVQAGGGEYFVSFAMEFLWNFLFCVAGWLAGIALRYGFFKFL